MAAIRRAAVKKERQERHWVLAALVLLLPVAWYQMQDRGTATVTLPQGKEAVVEHAGAEQPGIDIKAVEQAVPSGTEGAATVESKDMPQSIEQPADTEQPGEGGGGAATEQPDAAAEDPPEQVATADGQAEVGTPEQSQGTIEGLEHEGRWAGMEELWEQLPKQIPEWARQCTQPPCSFGAMEDGPTPMEMPFNSQFQEDEWLQRHLFYEKRGGFFLELGALNGKDGSNTIWFERQAGWKGLLIEANPGMYDELVINRPEAIDVHAAVCGTFGKVHFHSDSFTGGIWEFMSEPFKEVWHKDEKVEDMPEVECVPLQYILDKLGITAIDLITLDVEGGELAILKTLDLARLAVKALVVETDGTNLQKDAEVTELLLNAGFEAVPKETDSELSQHNTVYVHKDAWPQLRHAPDVQKVVT